MSQLDLVIRNGTIVDGTRAAGRPGDLGIRDGSIVAIGQVEGDATEEIDATGQVVAPGFIDIHTHYDAQIFWDRGLSPSPWHGVTSVVVGNCGFGVAPTLPGHRDLILRTLENVEGMSLAALHAGLGAEWPFESFPEYLDAIEASGSAINVGALVGHTPIRTYVMGEEPSPARRPTDEIAAQRRLVREALEAGAIGFATSKARHPRRLRRKSGPEPRREPRGDPRAGQHPRRGRPRHPAGDHGPWPGDDGVRRAREAERASR